MTYNFFANKADKIEILEFIFGETDLRVFDHSSNYEQQICEYKSVEEITSKFDLENGNKFAVSFQLWTQRHKGDILFRKVELDPNYCNGHTFRFSSEGWGLIQLNFGGLKNNELHQSHIGHFNEKGAAKWEMTNLFNGKVSNWNWTEIQTTSRKLKYHLHNKLAVGKIGSLGVLKGAEGLEKQGAKLR
jgi:hypothetical protein